MLHLQRLKTQAQEVWAIEYLYQILQEHTGVILNPEQRVSLRARFDNEITNALQWLIDRRDSRIEQLTLKQALGKDWEFRFTVNYFLREEEYNDLPYQRLRKQIEEFFSAAIQGEQAS